MIDEWYEPSEIWNHWWKNQCIWVITHLMELKEGHYPTRDGGSGYTDAYGSSGSVRASHPTREAEEIYAEMDNRLCRCREDGALLKMYYLLNETNETLGKHFQCTPDEVDRRIKTALKYISRRKLDRPYRRWYYHSYQPKKF